MTPAHSSSEESDSTLTPAARELVESYLSEYRASLLSDASHFSRSAGDIRVDDVVKAAELARSQRSSTRRSLIVVTATGILGVLAGVLVNLLASPSSDAGSLGLTSLVVAVAALLTAISTTVVASRSLRMSGADRALKLAELVDEVGATESLVRRVAKDRAGVDDNSLLTVLSALERAAILSEADVDEFRRVMSLRNSIVHQRSIRLPAEAQAEALASMRELRSKLNGALRREPDEHLIEMRRAKEYEQRVIDALSDVVIEGAQLAPVAGDKGVDAVIDHPRASVFVAIQYQAKPMTFVQMANVVSRSAASPLLLVVNVEPGLKARSYLDDFKNVRLVLWQSPEDNDRLGWALASLIFGGGDATQ